MSLVIVKYNAGNIQSVLYALERIGAAAIVTDNHTAIQSGDKVIFPGVGEASSAIRYLKERQLDKLLVSLKQPVLGICLGMQRSSRLRKIRVLYCALNRFAKYNGVGRPT